MTNNFCNRSLFESHIQFEVPNIQLKSKKNSKKCIHCTKKVFNVNIWGICHQCVNNLLSDKQKGSRNDVKNHYIENLVKSLNYLYKYTPFTKYINMVENMTKEVIKKGKQLDNC